MLDIHLCLARIPSDSHSCCLLWYNRNVDGMNAFNGVQLAHVCMALTSATDKNKSNLNRTSVFHNIHIKPMLFQCETITLQREYTKVVRRFFLQYSSIRFAQLYPIGIPCTAVKLSNDRTPNGRVTSTEYYIIIANETTHGRKNGGEQKLCLVNRNGTGQI